MNNKEAEIEKVELSLLLRDIVHATIEEPECVYLSYDGKDAKLDDGNTEGYHKLKLQEIGTRIEFNFAPHVDSQRCKFLVMQSEEDKTSPTSHVLNAAEIYEITENTHGYSAEYVSCNNDSIVGVLFSPQQFTVFQKKPLYACRRLNIFWMVDDSDSFYPDRHQHPFEGHPSYKEKFLPGLEQGAKRLWQMSPSGKVTFVDMKDYAPVPLVGYFVDEKLNISFSKQAETVTSSEASQLEDGEKYNPYEFKLEVRPDYRRSTEWSGKSVFKLSSKDGRLEEPILNLLDRAEAKVEHVKYFEGKGSKSAFGEKSHYFSVELHDKSSAVYFPDASVYRQPQSFANLGIPVYLQSDTRFVPDITELAENEEYSDIQHKLKQLFECTDFEKDDVVLVSAYDDGEPCVSHLIGGKALGEMVVDVMGAFNLRITHHTGTSLKPKLEAHLEKQVSVASKAIEQDLDEYNGNIKEYLLALSDRLKDYQKESEEIKEVVDETEVFQKSANESIEASHKEWSAFAGELMKIAETVGAPNLQWLNSLRAGLSSLEKQQESLQNSLIKHEKEAKTIVEGVKSSDIKLQDVIKRTKSFSDAMPKSEEAHAKTQREFDVTIGVAEGRLNKSRASLAELREKEKKLDDDVSELRATKRLRDEKITNVLEKTEEQKRLKGYLRQKKVDLAALESELEHLSKDVKELQSSVTESKSRGIESKHATLKARAAELKIELDDWRALDKELKEQEREVEILESKLNVIDKRGRKELGGIKNLIDKYEDDLELSKKAVKRLGKLKKDLETLKSDSRGWFRKIFGGK